jgi:hypothetical protein
MDREWNCIWILFWLGIGEQPEQAMAWLGLGSAGADWWHQSILVGIQLLMEHYHLEQLMPT